MKTLLLDNYDSFSHILFQYLWEVNGEKPEFLRNDASLERIRATRFDNIVISPGPGHPGNARDFGICSAVIAGYPETPLLGVCLGHQGLGMSVGARVVSAPAVRHGKVAKIRHDGKGIFAGMPAGFEAVRYHSLVLESGSLPAGVTVTAVAEEDGQIMGIGLDGAPRFGVQFHPESIGTANGMALLANFRDISARWLGSGRIAVSSDAPRPPAVAVAVPATAVPPRPSPGRPKRVPESCELPWRDPEAVFASLFRGQAAAFWLDSLSEAVPGEPRITYMGSGVRMMEARGTEVRLWDAPEGSAFRLRETVREDPFAYIGRRMASTEPCRLPETQAFPGSFRGGLIGYFGYELKRFAEGGDLPSTPAPEMPDALFLEPDRILAFDPGAGKVFALLPPGSFTDGEEEREGQDALAWFRELGARWDEIPSDPDAAASARVAARPSPAQGPGRPAPPRLPWRLSSSKEEYLRHIASLQEAIRRGETYEACLTNELRAEADADPFEVYSVLRRINPAPYAAFLRFPQGDILSASPERFLKLDSAGNLSSRPIKGTRPRGATPAEDEALRADLASNEKDRSENLMIVDLMRNDFGRICEPGSVEAPDLMRVEFHPTVLQLVSTVRGRLVEGVGAVEAVRACFPGGSMTGAPKLRTMELLEALERRPRGVFSGALGFLGWDGAMDLGMVIRTLVHRDGLYSVGCGGAILAESDPEAEFAEAMLKASALLTAVEIAAVRL